MSWGVAAEATTIYVPDNYSTIQGAVNAANPEDIIIVRDGTYTENVDVNKDHLTITSQNGIEVTIVRAINPDDHIFEVTASHVSISGFTVRDATEEGKAGILCQEGTGYLNIFSNFAINNYCGIRLEGNQDSHSNVSDNSCSNNSYGITVYSKRNEILSNCTSNNEHGIGLIYSEYNTLRGNVMVGNGIYIYGYNSLAEFNTHEIDTSNTVNGKPVYYWANVQGGRIYEGAGQVILANCTDVVVENQQINNASVGIEIAYSANITVYNNDVSQNISGINLNNSLDNYIFKNDCSNNRFGVYLCYSHNNKVVSNNFTNDTYGAYSWASDDKYYLNNFIDNESDIDGWIFEQTWNSPEQITYTYNGNTYTNYLGNYWDDYTGTDASGDGIGDTPYNIDSFQDNYPLTMPFENYYFPPHFNLTFPLQNRNAYNARISAVFDHSMLNSYCSDDKMVTYSGEETTERTSYPPIDPIGCGSLYSFYKPGGGAFLVGKVNYVGIRSEKNNLVLQYDAHPGYDYPDDLGTPVLAAAEGDLSVVNENYGWVKITHDGAGVGYETHYLHLNWHIGSGRVAQGQQIGGVGNKGESSGNHLHFEVRYQGIPVDPYGWEGSGTDPYTMLTGAVNIRLWETLDSGTPGIDYILGSPADIVVTDSDGLRISKELNQIPRAAYDEVDIDGDGDLEDRVSILHKKVGEYLIDVIPESNALPTDTYSLKAVIDGQTVVLAEGVQIQDIPTEPYIFESKLNRADFDSDGDVDAVDLDTFVLHWLAEDCNYPDWCEGTDLDYSGHVNFVDFAIFAENWLWEKILADIDIDGDVDFVDYADFAKNWMNQNCDEPNWCSGADLNKSGSVDLYDLGKFAEYWLEGK